MSEKMKPWFVTEPGGPMGRWPGVMEQGGRIIAFTVPDEKTAKELVDLRAQLATVTADRDATMAANVTLNADRRRLLEDIERYGADQWRRGNAGKDPQEFDEWQRE